MNTPKDIESARKIIDDYEANIKATAARLAQEETFKRKSNQLVLRLLDQFIDTKIKLGQLTRENIEDAFSRYIKAYDQETLEAIYVSIVIQLLSHDFYGVESQSHRIGNGGLVWKGHSYENPYALYQHILEIMGNDPWGNNPIWFYEILMSLFEDPTYLPAEVASGRIKNNLMPKLRKLVDLQINPIDIPEESELTSGDMMFISNLFGGF